MLEWILLFFITIGAVLLFWEYAVYNDFVIIQKDFHTLNDASLLADTNIVVLRHMPPNLTKPWSIQHFEKRGNIPILSHGVNPKRTTLQTWLSISSPSPEWITYSRDSARNLATGIRLPQRIDDTCGFLLNTRGRLPILWTPETVEAHILRDHFVPLTEVQPEIQWICVTDGVPLSLWISNNSAKSVLRNITKTQRINPWALSSAEVPWVSELKYIEVLVKPGTMVGIPRGCFWSARPSDIKGTTWYWTAQSHSPISYLQQLNINA